MYSSNISAPIVNQTITYEDFLVCEVPQPRGGLEFSTMELYPVDYWYGHNVDGFGKPFYNDWDVFWFSEALATWPV